MAFTDEQKLELNLLINDHLNSCRTEVDERINLMHSDMHQLRAEFHEFRKEFTEFTAALSGPLERIATHMEQLAGLPEAWGNFKGFMGFLKWIKDYWFVFVLFGVLISGSVYLVLKEFLG